MITALMLVTTVAVMPFKDLSGGKGQVGEAIRETVTSDLKDTGLKVVERGNIDKVIAEQNLQAKKNDLGMAESIRVGTLLGATMIVAGAYQKAASQVRVTARFVDVATGEIKGSAKVDGSTSDFLSLQDKITAELMKSAGLGHTEVQHFAKRVRPKMKSFKAIELYGDAVTQTDENKKIELLKLSLNEDPQFVYASRDLDALEQRMKQYDAVSTQAQKRATDDLLRAVQTEKDPNLRNAKYGQLLGQLEMQHRLKRLIAVARAIVANPPPVGQYGYDAAEQAQNSLVRAYYQLHDDDGALREGEKFLAKYPASTGVSTVRMFMTNAIQHKHDVEDGKRAAAAAIAALPPDKRNDPCETGRLYFDNHQLLEARRDYLACDARGGPKGWAGVVPAGTFTFILARLALDLNDGALMHKVMPRLERENPNLYRTASVAGWDKLPTDD